MLLDPFTDHPSKVGETYLEHMRSAFGFGIRMVSGGVACLLHGLLPFIFRTTGSDQVRVLHHRMVTHRTAPALGVEASPIPGRDPAPAALRVLSTASGLVLTCSIALAAWLTAKADLLGSQYPWPDAIMLAMLLGMLVRTVWTPPGRFERGIDFSAKPLLEIAVALMGATIGIDAIMTVGLPLAMGIVVTVVVALASGILLGRIFGLPDKVAILVACGTAICGNSAIAAAATALDADKRELTTAMAFTALLSIAVVLALPVAMESLHLGAFAGGALAGLTVYAVPHVVAAAAPMGPVALQTGAVVKLGRVLMLGPIVCGLALLMAGRRKAMHPGPARKRLSQFAPPFILAFLALVLLRSWGVLPEAVVESAGTISGLMTLPAMAALGLSADLRKAWAAGPQMICVVILSQLALGGIALCVLFVASIA